MSKIYSNINTSLEQGKLKADQIEYPRGKYDCFPTFKIDQGSIETGYEYLSTLIKSSIPKGLRVLMIDGFQGVDWPIFKNSLSENLARFSIIPTWYAISDCFANSEEIQKRVEPFMGGDDRVFGTHYPFGPEIFFDAGKIAEYRIIASAARGNKSGNLTIFYGVGAGILEQWDKLWYLDFPKDFIQMEARKNRPMNTAENTVLDFEAFYKRSYFVEWPAFNRQKQKLLPFFDLFLDAQDINIPSAIDGHELRKALFQISESPFRVRPWFFPGPWGGKFMQGHMGLDPDQPNFAWSFELIVPENGIILEKENQRLEFSFDLLMYQETERILGKEASSQFKYEWPIRFDYLDTVDGGNLSTQVHPRPDYVRKKFGETYTQDETYYIVAAKPDARVYLGLTEDCDPKVFRTALEDSIREGKALDIDRFVNSEPSDVHDLFLIPNGTVHCSGAGNMVLEISATPYIFTFKIYDYLRRDLEGNLRPINIERAFANIRFERRKHWVQNNLLAKPVLLREGAGWKEEILYDKPYTFYKVHRIEFSENYETETNDRGLAINLVAGEQIDVISENGRHSNLNYLETMLIPAAAGKIKFVNTGQVPCIIILVYVKPGIGTAHPLNNPQDG